MSTGGQLSDTPSVQASGVSRALRSVIKASFAWDLMVFLVLWPVWWLLGIDQLLPPFFLAWEMGRLLLQRRRLECSLAIGLAALSLAWCLVPLPWVQRQYLDNWLKTLATFGSQAFVIFLFWNAVRSADDWWKVVRGLNVVAAWVAGGGLVFALGLWRGTWTSALGRALPASWTQSEFFSSISLRALGSVGNPDSLLGIRLSSLALHPSGLSMLGLLFIPFVVWRLWHARGWRRVAQGAILAGLCLCLVWSESRFAYLAFAAACVAVLGIEKGWFARRPWLVPLAVGVLAVLVIVLLVVYPGWSRIVRVVSDLATAWRPGSWRARLRVYEETLRLIPQHPLAGWGVAVRIPGMRSTFSAGSHSGYLAMLFQHGVVGLALYVGLWLAVWREIVHGLHGRAMPRWFALRFPWLMSAAAMFALNIRELADGWRWDQLVAMTVWTLWGLILVAPRLGVGTGAQTPCPEGAAPAPSAQRTRAQCGQEVDQ